MYGRWAAGLATVYALRMLAHAMGIDGDDEDEDRPPVDLDYKSPTFGQLRWGNDYIDISSNILPTAHFVYGKLLAGEVKDEYGKYAERPRGVSILNWLRYKSSPFAGNLVSYFKGETIAREEFTWRTAFRDMYAPLSVEQIHETMTTHGIPKGLSLTVMSVIGLNNRNQGEFWSPFGTRSESLPIFRWIRSHNARHPEAAWAPSKPDYTFGHKGKFQMSREQRDQFDRESGLLATEKIKAILGKAKEPTLKQIKNALSDARSGVKVRLAKLWGGQG
jgi:hypothetical protein